MAFNMQDALKKIDAVVQSEKFKTSCNEFIVQHCDQFDYVDENKLEYTTIHKQYEERVEALLEEMLDNSVDMAKVIGELPTYIKEQKVDAESAETIELLTSLGDFVLFKGLMLMAKKDKESNNASSLFMDAKGLRLSGCEEACDECVKLCTVEEGWTVNLDKGWLKMETKKVGTEEYMRTAVVMDLTMQQAEDMMFTTSPDRIEWTTGIKSLKVIREYNGPTDLIMEFGIKMPGLMKYLGGYKDVMVVRMATFRDRPEPGCVAHFIIPWDLEKDAPSLDDNISKFKFYILRPVPGEPTKSALVGVEKMTMKWIPEWMRGLMFSSMAPKMMMSMISNFKKTRGIK